MRIVSLCALLASTPALADVDFTEILASGTPAARRSPGIAAVPDAGGERVYMYGGFNGAPINSFAFYDTAANAWTDLTGDPLEIPYLREQAPMAFDAQSGHLVLFGGLRPRDLTCIGIFGCTWDTTERYRTLGTLLTVGVVP